MINKLFFSPASLWEIIIKQGLERPDFQVNARLLRKGLLENKYQELAIISEHAIAVGELPPLLLTVSLSLSPKSKVLHYLLQTH